ncbi:hypothetical protein [Hymenobacter arizonensis]|uniref:hypothetical protein n=1 Tax=Hymenobacter arizonensis TaxID=1227077 RepID=UPI001160C93B|nr:hypothetical protein [Hymenobacter arizonensis]
MYKKFLSGLSHILPTQNLVLRTFAEALGYNIMKSLFKFTLLFALIVSGKLAKQPAAAAMAKNAESKPAADTSMVFVSQMIPAQSVKPAHAKAKTRQTGTDLIANLF